MKCKYCNAEVEQDARFCPNCGKDLSKFDKCVNCGEFLDQDAAFCPHCGTEQPHYVEGNGSRRWVWLIAVVAILILLGGGYWYYAQIQNPNQLVEAVDMDVKVIVDNNEAETENSRTLSSEEVISIKDAISIADRMIVENGEFKGLSSVEEVDNIMLNKYGYKKEDSYYSYREWDFSPFYYKNCLLGRSTKEGNDVFYAGVPTEGGDSSSFVGFDSFSDSMVIACFTEAVFNDCLNQIKQLGAKLVNEDNYELQSYKICVFRNGVLGIRYGITIGKD